MNRKLLVLVCVAGVAMLLAGCDPDWPAFKQVAWFMRNGY